MNCKTLLTEPVSKIPKLIVAGTRTFNDEELAYGILDEFIKGREVEIVSGMAKGADTIGYHYAIDRHLPKIEFWADWDKHGKKAGYLRNEEMAKYADACLVFWDGKSSGSKHMIGLAKKHNLILKVVEYE